MLTENKLVDLFRHSRHDWLNAIQLIKGNLALNHVDRAKEIIDDLIMKSKNEAKLSNLEIPKTAVYLLTYNWYSHQFKLDIEVVGDHGYLTSLDNAILSMSQSVFELFDKHSSSRSENHVLYTIQLIDEEKFISIDFSGKLEDVQQLVQTFGSLTYQSMNLIEHYIKEDEALFTFQIQEKI